jgi:lipoate---protein ligase
MKLCELTLPTPEENLACDEALLDLCEAGGSEEILRLWAPQQYFVVLGYANKAETEANLLYCRRHAIPVLRRCTGGGTVLQGPGVLNYSLILRTNDSSPCHSISATNQFILERHRDAMVGLLWAPVAWKGQTDLAIGGLKFAGNAQRRRQRFLLFHGSFLLHLDLSLVEQVLPLPSRQPDYRVNRSHSDFLINLNVPASKISNALIKAWDAAEPLTGIPTDQITFLASEKYSLDEWNFRF